MTKISQFFNLSSRRLLQNGLWLLLITLSVKATASAPPLPASLSGTAAQCTARYMVINQLSQQFGQKSSEGMLDRIVATAALSVVTGGEKQFFSAFQQELTSLKPYLEVFNQSEIDTKKGFENMKVLNDAVKPCLILDKDIQAQQPSIVSFLTGTDGQVFQKKLAQSMP